jgi:hypothetical protein
MKKWQVSYYLDNFYHAYVIDANNEAEAYEKVLKSIPTTSKTIMHDLKIERYFQKWN